jgi:hypothetical protein
MKAVTLKKVPGPELALKPGSINNTPVPGKCKINIGLRRLAHRAPFFDFP